jgi:hypothetical protein
MASMNPLPMPALSAYLQRLKRPDLTSAIRKAISTQDTAAFDHICRRVNIPNESIAQLRRLLFSVNPNQSWPPIWW